MMKINIERELEVAPFSVPEHLEVKTGTRGAEYVKLTYISAVDLDRLCDQFRADVFKLAGKQPPERHYKL
jgi:hypothetical protein